MDMWEYMALTGKAVAGPDVRFAPESTSLLYMVTCEGSCGLIVLMFDSIMAADLRISRISTPEISSLTR